MALDFLSGIFGSKPDVAPYTPTDLPTEQLNAILGNISAFPDVEKLGSLYQDYMTSGFEKAGIDINALLKGGSDSTEQMLAMADKFMSGEIPQDVQDQIYRSDAFKGLMSGGGSSFTSSLQARDLGLTSLNLIGEGASLAGQAGNAAQRWAGLASGLIMSPSGMMITPQQQAAMTMQNNLYKQSTQQLRNNVAAAPDPALKGLSDIVENLTAAYLGGKVGTIGAGNADATKAATPLYGEGSSTSNALGPAMESAFPDSSYSGYSKDTPYSFNAGATQGYGYLPDTQSAYAPAYGGSGPSVPTSPFLSGTPIDPYTYGFQPFNTYG